MIENCYFQWNVATSNPSRIDSACYAKGLSFVDQYRKITEKCSASEAMCRASDGRTRDSKANKHASRELLINLSRALSQRRQALLFCGNGFGTGSVIHPQHAWALPEAWNPLVQARDASSGSIDNRSAMRRRSDMHDSGQTSRKLMIMFVCFNLVVQIRGAVQLKI
jgi:hypothetical protein